MSDTGLARDGTVSAATAVTVHIVDDNDDLRETASRLVRSLGLCVQDHACGSAFLQHYDPHAPGCIILDVNMPGMSGLELQEILNARELPPPIIFVTGQAEIPRAIKAIRAGAVDFLIKPFRAEALFERIFEAIDLDFAHRRKHAISGEIRGRLAHLTGRESQITQLLSLGESVKHIAHSLGISPKTVDNHRARILEKLNVDNPTQLANLLAQLS